MSEIAMEQGKTNKTGERRMNVTLESRVKAAAEPAVQPASRAVNLNFFYGMSERERLQRKF